MVVGAATGGGVGLRFQDHLTLRNWENIVRICCIMMSKFVKWLINAFSYFNLTFTYQKNQLQLPSGLADEICMEGPLVRNLTHLWLPLWTNDAIDS